MHSSTSALFTLIKNIIVVNFIFRVILENWTFIFSQYWFLSDEIQEAWKSLIFCFYFFDYPCIPDTLVAVLYVLQTSWVVVWNIWRHRLMNYKWICVGELRREFHLSLLQVSCQWLLLALPATSLDRWPPTVPLTLLPHILQKYKMIFVSKFYDWFNFIDRIFLLTEKKLYFLLSSFQIHNNNCYLLLLLIIIIFIITVTLLTLELLFTNKFTMAENLSAM